MTGRLAELIDGLLQRDAVWCDRVADALHEMAGGSRRSIWSILDIPKPTAPPRPSAAFTHAERLARRDDLLRGWAGLHFPGLSKSGAATIIERTLARWEQKFRDGNWRGGPVPAHLLPSTGAAVPQYAAAILELDLKVPSVGSIRKILAKPVAPSTDGQSSRSQSPHQPGGDTSHE